MIQGLKLISVALLSISLISGASAQQKAKAVKHAHNGRLHSHVLPNNGVGQHNHGNPSKKNKTPTESHTVKWKNSSQIPPASRSQPLKPFQWINAGQNSEIDSTRPRLDKARQQMLQMASDKKTRMLTSQKRKAEKQARIEKQLKQMKAASEKRKLSLRNRQAARNKKALHQAALNQQRSKLDSQRRHLEEKARLEKIHRRVASEAQLENEKMRQRTASRLAIQNKNSQTEILIQKFISQPQKSSKPSNKKQLKKVIRKKPAPKKKVQKNSRSNFNCAKKYCKAMSSCAEARYKLEQCGHTRLDRDNDGIPCENVCQ